MTKARPLNDVPRLKIDDDNPKQKRAKKVKPSIEVLDKNEDIKPNRGRPIKQYVEPQVKANLTPESSSGGSLVQPKGYELHKPKEVTIEREPRAQPERVLYQQPIYQPIPYQSPYPNLNDNFLRFFN